MRFIYNASHPDSDHNRVISGVLHAIDDVAAADHIELCYPPEEGWIITLRPAPADYLEA